MDRENTPQGLHHKVIWKLKRKIPVQFNFSREIPVQFQEGVFVLPEVICTVMEEVGDSRGVHGLDPALESKGFFIVVLVQVPLLHFRTA